MPSGLPALSHDELEAIRKWIEVGASETGVVGDNYGWSMLEHTQAVHPERPRGPTPIVPATAAHDHTESRSITGGHVYRGSRLPKLTSSYVYGDYVTGKLWGIGIAGGETSVSGGKLTEPFEVADSTIQVICFGVDHNKELYVVGYDGSIHRLIENPVSSANLHFPKTLSASGLFSATSEHRLAAGVIPYSINAEPWEDGTLAERFIAIPGDARLGVHETNNVQKGDLKGEWSYPTDTVIGKTISLETEPGNPLSRRRLETQILHRSNDEWHAYAFVWNDAQTDAVLSGGGSAGSFDRTFEVVDPTVASGKRRQTWHFASRSECLTCHSTRGGSVYGFRPDQLNRDHEYNGRTDNQLRTFAELGLFERPLVPDDAPTLEQIPKLVAPHDGLKSLSERVRSYLHVNCAHCHRRGGGGTAAMDVQQHLALDKTDIVSRPTQGTFGMLDAWLVSPGDPYRSVIYYRMSKVGKGRMPHFGSQVVDVRGIRLMHDWIEQLSAQPGNLNAPATADELESVSKLQTSNEQSLLLLTGGLGVTGKLQTAAIARLQSSTSGALMLASFVRGFGRDLDPAINQQAIARGVAHTDPQVRDLFEPFIPEEQRTKRLGTAFDSLQLLAMQGDAKHGRELFFNSTTLQCRNCHQVGDQGRALGPKFDKIGTKYSRAEILENILDPSRKVEPEYRTWLVETTTGRVINGVLTKRTDAGIELKDATGKLFAVKTDEIELLLAAQKSLMPELLLKDMTAQDVADLLAFLAGLK